ncbi:MAG: polyhydroxyalkanoate biosynthesis repressor PhaR [Bacteroidetes bacterium]|nr:MAG: polyhydroxyalkanoate biosynthesis repressor PhaR [Bacteroidota bacterium]
MNQIKIYNRLIGEAHKPFVIAEIGINHEGNFDLAIKMIDEAHKAGCECVKFQTHIIEDEMIPNDVIPGNAKESIWDIMKRCRLTEEEEIKIKEYVESLGMFFLSTPFSRAAADRLQKIGVPAFKIGSGECNNYPLVEHIAKFGKPVILSTGMNDIKSIQLSVEIFRKYKVPYALMHCTSMYPTPYEKVRLGALNELKENFPDAVLGLSDHSMGIYTCLGAVPFGASILEKHFTSDMTLPGPDIPISIEPYELRELIIGSEAIHKALGGTKEILKEEQPTIDFAYSCVVSIKDIKKGEIFSYDNIWVKRPGTGEIKAVDFRNVIGKKTNRDIQINSQINWTDIE